MAARAQSYIAHARSRLLRARTSPHRGSKAATSDLLLALLEPDSIERHDLLLREVVASECRGRCMSPQSLSVARLVRQGYLVGLLGWLRRSRRLQRSRDV